MCFIPLFWVALSALTRLGSGKDIWPVQNMSGGVLVWLSLWSEVQTCMWPSWCLCYSLSLASVKSRLVLPFISAHPGRPGQSASKRVCVCVCVLRVELWSLWLWLAAKTAISTAETETKQAQMRCVSYSQTAAYWVSFFLWMILVCDTFVGSLLTHFVKTVKSEISCLLIWRSNSNCMRVNN